MAELTIRNAIDSVKTLLKELFFGPDKDAVWVINPTDQGLLSLLQGVTHDQANRTLIKGRAGIAGHANHILFHLGLINRSMKGENAFANADWEGSWKIGELNGKEWSTLISDIRAAVVEAAGHLSDPFEYDQIALTGTLALAVHIGYHLGEVKQLMALL